MPADPSFFESVQREMIPLSLTSSSAIQNNAENQFFFSASEFGMVFIKSFFCALLKKAGLDQASLLQNRSSQFTCFMIDASLVLAFSFLCASLFGYSLLFSLAMETTNHVLRRTDNARWIIASSPAFYAPGIILGWMNNANRASDENMMRRYAEHGLRSSVSGVGGLMGFLLANWLGPKKTNPKTYFNQLHHDCIEYMKGKSEKRTDNQLLPSALTR